MPLKHDERTWVTHAAAAMGHSVTFAPPVEAFGLPAFVASDPRLRPCRYEATVRLHARTFADLPDFN